MHLLWSLQDGHAFAVQRGSLGELEGWDSCMILYVVARLSCGCCQPATLATGKAKLVACPQGQGCREWEHDSLEMLTGKAPEVDTLPEQLMVTQLKSTARGRTWQHNLLGFCP